MAKLQISLATRRWLNQIKGTYVLESHHLHLLELIGACWDRVLDARKTIAAEGSFVYDRFQQRKVHPAVDVEQRAMINFSRLLREIGFDIDQGPESRPPRQY